MSDLANDTPRDLSGETKITHIIYALNALGFLTGGLTSIAAIIMNYVKRDDVKGTFLESHFNWQIRTFWWSLLWAVIGFVTMVILVGFVILAADCIWVIYRIIKGWLALNENKPIV
jgi:uncharacterized membrane protein